MSLVFLSINLFALLNCIQLLHSELLSTIKRQSEGFKQKSEEFTWKEKKMWWRKHPDHGVAVTRGPL